MRRFALILFALLALVGLSVGQSTAPSRIRVYDELRVYVYGNKDVSGDFSVQTDGAIYVPRLGRIVVNGLTAPKRHRRA